MSYLTGQISLNLSITQGKKVAITLKEVFIKSMIREIGVGDKNVNVLIKFPFNQSIAN